MRRHRIALFILLAINIAFAAALLPTTAHAQRDPVCPRPPNENQPAPNNQGRCPETPTTWARGNLDGGNYYHPEQGDTLFSIANRFCVTMRAICEQNPTLRRVMPGIPIRIPRTAPVTPVLTIESPAPNTTLLFPSFDVSGTGPSGSAVWVRAEDNRGAELTGWQTVNATTTPSGRGTWRVTLVVNAAPGTPGYIVASGGGPTPVRVPVTFGSSTSVTIESPAPNTTLLFPSFDVSGTGPSGSPVWVRAEDNRGAELTGWQTVNATTTPSGRGTWRVTLVVNAAPGTPGYIVASGGSPTPVRVPVTFGSSTSVTIESPAPNTTLLFPSFDVSGTGPSGSAVWVRAEDNRGAELTGWQTVNATTTPSGRGNWRVTLVVNAAPGTPGYIVASGGSPAPVRVPVTFGSSTSVTIESPAPNTTLLFPSFDVSGTGPSGSPVWVRAEDNRGAELTGWQNVNATTTPSGRGNWRVTLVVNVAPGTPGYIVASGGGPAPVRVPVTFSSGVR